MRWMCAPLAVLLGAGTGVASRASAAETGPTFALGTATARRGETARGVLTVPAGADAALDIPVAVAHGRNPGPVLALVAGSHGTEYASILAVEELIDRVDAAALSGTVLLVPLVNVPSFEAKVPHLNPVDGKNMNRFYPGRADGTQTERASYALTRHVVERSDHLIDLHGGDLDESLRPYSYWTRTGRAAQDALSRDMALAFGLDHIVISTDRPTDPAASRYLENTATTRGKPSITVEAGAAGTTEREDVDALVQGCLSVMRQLRMLPGSPARVEHPVWIERLANVNSELSGIFHPLVRRGAYVAKGMKLGYLTDYLNHPIAEPRAPDAGVILYIRAVPSLTKGETLASIGVVGAEP